jgi:hypothetical protein
LTLPDSIRAYPAERPSWLFDHIGESIADSSGEGESGLEEFAMARLWSYNSVRPDTNIGGVKNAQFAMAAGTVGNRRYVMRIVILLVFLGSLLMPMPSAANMERSKHKLVEIFIELFKNEDQAVSLGAMLVSIDINDYHELEKYVRSTIKEKDEKWIRCIKLFVISRYTWEDVDAVYFIESIPEDAESFRKLIDFESSVLRHPCSHILSHLMDYADKRIKRPHARIHEMAKKKIIKIEPLSDGWVGECLEPVRPEQAK